MTVSKADKFADLRKRAEELLSKTPNPVISHQDTDFFKILHELDTYRIELELQNEEYQAANEALNIAHKKLENEIAVHFRHYDIAPVGYAALDYQGIILELNQTLATMLGLNKQDLTYHPFNEFIYTADQDIFYFCRQMLTTTQKPQSCELRLSSKNTESFWTKLDCVPEQHGQQVRTHIAISNITHLKLMEKDLHLAASVFNECSEAFMITDAKLNIIKVNPAFTVITGYSEQEVIGQSPKILQSGKHDAFFYQAMWTEINQHQQWQGELWNRRKSGEIYPEWLSIKAIQNNEQQITHYIGLFTDITQRKHNEANMHFMAYYDSLTHLPNRTLLQNRLKQALSLSQRNHHHGAVFILDIDHFKAINDSLGHLVGDELLIAVATRLSSCVREEDTVSRMGGDEFVIVLADLSDNKKIAIRHAMDVARKIINTLSEPVITKENNIQITVSIGIVMFPDDADQVTHLIKLADTALYKVKESGRNNYQFVTLGLQQEAERRLKVQDGLYGALHKKEFEVYYQPQVNLAKQAIVGAEALIRWHHPEHNLVLPASFIAIAEESGLIIPVGIWVLEQVCEQIALWNKIHQSQLDYIAVNISTHQFREKNFVTEIERIIAKNKINPRQLELEITESVLIQDFKKTNEKLAYLKAMGVRLAIDDFGTGYSSLQYIKRLPLDMIKIDQSFVHDIGNDTDGEVIVQTIIGLAKNLGLAVLAEGVESQQQLDFLKQNGCDNYQGYHYSKPVSAREFFKLFRNATALVNAT